MLHKAAIQGCDQAIFPFSVAAPSSVSEETNNAGHDLAPLCLTLQQDERVRVLQRDRQHNRHHRHGSGGDDPSNVVLTQWCIAQREDGAVGLVPVSVLHRVPGARFLHRGVASSTPRGSRHCDPEVDKSTIQIACGDEQRAMKRHGLGQCETSSSSSEEDDDAVEDAMELQKRRKTSLKDRLRALTSPGTCVTPLHRDRSSACAAATSSPSPTQARSSKHRSRSVSPSVEAVVKTEDDEECAQLMDEAARTSAEVEWLSRTVVARLCEACEAVQREVAEAEREATGQNDEVPARTLSNVTCAAIRREEKDVATEEEAHLAAQMKVAIALKAWLDRRADSDEAEAADDKFFPPLSESSDADLAGLFSSCDINCASSAKNKTHNTDDGRRLGGSAPQQDSYRIDQLRHVVQEESETIECYRDQRCKLQQRLASLEELTQELAAEGTALATSETALQAIVAAQAQSHDNSVAPWPRTLPGLTEEEEAALCSSVAMCDKYTRKLKALDPTFQSRLSSSLDLSEIGGGQASARSITTAADKGVPSTPPTTPDRRHAAQAADTAASPGRTTSPSDAARVVEHLRQVLDTGDRKCAQLQAKLQALQDFCVAYGPAAREIEEQLQRGQHILAEKRNFLAQL